MGVSGQEACARVSVFVLPLAITSHAPPTHLSSTSRMSQVEIKLSSSHFLYSCKAIVLLC